MNFFKSLFGTHSPNPEDTGPTVNPATGLPMIDRGIGGVDVGGSPYGVDVHTPGTPWPQNGADWGCGSGENNF